MGNIQKTLDVVGVWNAALELLKGEVGAQGFDTWFRSTRAVAWQAHTVVIEVPNRFVRDWLLEHYAEVIDRCLRQVAGEPLTLDIRVGTSIAAQAGPGEELPRPEAPPAPALPARPAPTPAELGLHQKYTLESFVVGSSNRFAHAAAMAVATSPGRAYNPLFIYGGVGLGKTHLLHAIGLHVLAHQPRAKILYLSSEHFTNQLITAIQTRSTVKFRERYRTVDVLLIDDVHFIAGKESTQEEFFHTFNALYDAHKQIVLCSDRPPKEIRGLEERLVSRFEWGLLTDVQPPDLETRIAILRKKAEAHPVRVPDEVMTFIAERVRSNIRELEGALIRVVAYASLGGHELTAAMAQDVLKELVLEEAKRVSIDDIQHQVAAYFDIRAADMKTKRRTKQVAYPRQVAMYLARGLTDASLPAIGESFGGRDHSTVLYACEKIEGLVRTTPEIARVVDHLRQTIRGTP